MYIIIPLNLKLLSKEKIAIDQHVRAEIMVEVHNPTPCCSNMLCREHPSQTINKPIKRPICEKLPLYEQLQKLDKAYF